ncbi:MAG: ribokinase [Christensenellales bacterium]|jgi:ribokinase
MKKILVAGSLNMDWVFRVAKIPVIGETCTARSLEKFAGGKGANQCYAVARLGGDVSMLGLVGDDEAGDALRRNLLKAGAKVGGVEIIKGVSSGLAVIYVGDDASNCITVLPGANNLLSAQWVKAHDDAISGCDILLLQQEIPFEAVTCLIERAFELRKTILLNPAPARFELPDDLLAKVDYITPNETELSLLSGLNVRGIGEAKEAAHRLIARGCGCVVCTLGAQGCLVCTPEQTTHHRAVSGTKVVDTTGAGDCFNGAFAVALSQGMDAHQSAVFANAAAGVAVGRMGAQASMPTIEEVRKGSR